MRFLEVLLWTIAVAWTAWRVAGAGRWRADAAFIVSAAVAAAAHAASEGVRVQMIPVYAALVALASWSTWQICSRGGLVVRRWNRVATASIASIWLAIAAAVPTVFPVFHYDTLSGPYSIGTTVYELAGAPRGRSLVVQLWYPTPPDASGAIAGITTHPAPLEAAYGAFTGLPRSLFDRLRLVRTHARAGAPLASDRRSLPVVLFSHGPLGANRSQSIFQMEALASAGFVAIAIDHTGYASAAIFPDGRVVFPAADAAWPVFVDARSTAMLQTWVADVRFVLDRLAGLNAHDPRGLLTGRLDLDRVGYLGASFGGSVVVQALLDEPRIKAGVAEDGKPYFSDATPTDLTRPLMYMQSAAPYIPSTDAQLARWGLTSTAFRTAEQDHYVRQMQLFGRVPGPIYNVYLRRTNHLTFSDLPLIIRVPDRSLMDVRRAHRIINAYTLAFFDRYLNGVPGALVDGHTPSPYAEVTVASRNIPPAVELARNER